MYLIIMIFASLQRLLVDARCKLPIIPYQIQCKIDFDVGTGEVPMRMLNGTAANAVVAVVEGEFPYV